MNFFLLTAVPLAAVVVHRLNHRDRPPFADVVSWIWGSVWSLAALILASFFGGWRVFNGDLTGVFFGLVFNDVLLVPGLVVAAWVLTRPGRDAWELALWLAIAFTMAGIRDFASTSPSWDLHELFLVPLNRILVLLALPVCVLKAVHAPNAVSRGVWSAVASLVALSAPVFAVLSFANAGWLVWPVETVAIAALVLGERLVLFVQRITSAAPPAQP